MKDRELKKLFEEHKQMPADDGFTNRVMRETQYYCRIMGQLRRSYDWIVWVSALIGLAIVVFSGAFGTLLEYVLPVLTDWGAPHTTMNYLAVAVFLGGVACTVSYILAED